MIDTVRDTSLELMGGEYCESCCCSVLRCVAVCLGVLHCVAVRCSVLQCDAVCCNTVEEVMDTICELLLCVAVCCIALQYAAGLILFAKPHCVL